MSDTGTHVVYQSALDSNLLRPGLILRNANGAGEGELLAEGVKFPQEASPDGRFILYLMRGEKTRLDLYALSLVDHKEYPLLNSPFQDGRQLYYLSASGEFYNAFSFRLRYPKRLFSKIAS